MSNFALVGPVDPNIDSLKGLIASGEVDCVIAVDGGYQHLVDAGIECFAAVGDFDSLGYVPQGIEVVVKLPTHKDQTDTEEALALAAKGGAERIYVYGTLGGRVDHTLAFLQLLGECGARRMDVVAIGDEQAVIPIWGEGRNHVSVAAGVCGTFSLLAMSDVVYGVTEQGVEYEVQDTFLYNAQPLGISNEFIGKPAFISVNRGSALLFVPVEALSSLKF